MRVFRKTGAIEPGAEVELQIGPIRWLARHTAYEKDHFFEDIQVSGPFAKWVHRHQFEPVGNTTRLTDRVEYQLPGGALINVPFAWAVHLGLLQMFDYRHRATKRHCER